MLLFPYRENGVKIMYTVMIVDKKKQMFRVYKNMLHWDRYNFEVISFADTMDDAISYYREYRHDLIISDTEFKDGNGIHLFTLLKKVNTNCHMIICSFDTTYELVRQALRSGCMDYLRKDTLKNADIIENLEWIRNDYLQRYGEIKIDWHEELKRILGLIRDKQSFQVDELYHLLKRKELKILKDSYRILYFRLDDVKENFWHHRFENRTALNNMLKMTIDEELQSFPISCVTLFSKMHAGSILIEKCLYEHIYTLACNLIKQCKERYDMSISIFISKECRGYEMFYDSYVTYSNSLYCRFYMGNEQIISMDELPAYQMIDIYNFTYREEIVRQIELYNFQDLDSSITLMLSKMKELKIKPEDVIHYCRSIIDVIERQAIKKGIDKNPLLFDQFHNTFLRIETLDVLHVQMISIMKDITSWITASPKYLYSDIVRGIMQYVNQHIYEKITLQDIADAMKRTPIHISRVFKKQTGENLMHYINRCKMEKAAILLMEQKQMKVKEIAKKLSMEDQLYFNKVFRRYYQESPREYRKNR